MPLVKARIGFDTERAIKNAIRAAEEQGERADDLLIEGRAHHRVFDVVLSVLEIVGQFLPRAGQRLLQLGDLRGHLVGENIVDLVDPGGQIPPRGLEIDRAPL